MAFINFARRVKNSSRILRQLHAYLRSRFAGASKSTGTSAYLRRVAAERATYQDVVQIHDLPAIFHYWSNKHLRPMLELLGFSNPDQFFAKHLVEAAARCEVDAPKFISLGAGNCDTEVRVAKLVRAAGVEQFVIECVDLNPHTLARGAELARSEGVETHLRMVEADFNSWQGQCEYAGVIANQSLHHMLELEKSFAAIRAAMLPKGLFITSDIIGRNGHLRWPEALAAVEEFWQELPDNYRYNHQLDRHEKRFQDWDCSVEGFEGIRAQDILALLLKNFHFRLFAGFANVIDPFVDRSFGHNFDAQSDWDQDFIDRIHAFDEASFRAGSLKPTHMMAVLTLEAECAPILARGLRPEDCVRVP